MGRGLLPVILLLVAAVVASAQGPRDAPYLPERQTECWECHSAWPHTPEPLRSFYNVFPEPVVVPESGAFDLDVQVQNAWYHDVRYLEPVLDLTDAPSLKFFDGRDPVSAGYDGSVDVTPRARLRDLPNVGPDTEYTKGPYGGAVVLDVPPGTTSLSLWLNETTPSLDPDVTWNVFAGASKPTEHPDFVLHSDGGGGARLDLDGPSDFAGLGFGNWTVQAQVYLAQDDPSNVDPTVGNVTFRVDSFARFDAGASRTSLLGRQVRLEPFQSTLFSWSLEVVRPPQPGETLGLTVNGTAFYLHPATANANDDWGNVTKGMTLAVVPVDGAEASRVGAGAVRIEPGDGFVAVTAPAVDVGVSLVAVLEAVGYASAFLVVASVYTGGVFGRSSRRRLNAVFGTARRRVAFHNFLSYGLTLAAAVHTALFLWTNIADETFHWSLGILWGGVALLALLGLGVTGALQVPMIRRWDYATWRWTHLGLTIAAVVFTLLHLLLDGVHFDAVQEWLGYRNPLDTRTA